MLYSGNLLKRYLSLSIDSEEIAQELTVKTCEVEEHQERNIPDKVVIGRVDAVETHPDADKLVVCQLDCGDKGKRQICTGGENVVEGSYVPVALPGCHLPAINLTIEPRKLRGLESNGMICSKEELGIPEDIDEHWIWTLQYAPQTDLATVPQQPDVDDITESDLGTPLGDKYPWLENWTIDVENKTITHRPDMFGHFGLSVELHTIFDASAASFANGKKHMEQMLHGSILETLDNADQIKRDIHITTNQAYTYVLVELDEVQVDRSDLYLRLAVHDLGVQPKNNRIDFSNLFMYLTGQPVHFFDADKVAGDITVRQAKEGEQFTDLNSKTHNLTPEDIVITDQKSIIALAGVIGGQDSQVDASTKRILVEIGNFDPVAVRKTGTRLGLRTEAELRFEKHINPLFSLHAVHMLLDELHYFEKSLSSFEIGGLAWWSSEHANIQVKQSVDVSFDHIKQMIGVDDKEFTDKAISILTDLGFTVHDDGRVEVPLRRSPRDCTREADIVEEVARIYGYDQLPEKDYTDTIEFVGYSKEVQIQRLLEDYLTGAAQFTQIETYPWIHQRRLDLIDKSTDHLYEMANPLSPEQSYLRDTMVWSIVELLEKNAPFYDQLRLFDIGKTWDESRDKPEHTVLSMGIWQKSVTDWTDEPYLQLKGYVEALLTRLGVDSYELVATEHGYFHPRQQAEIIVDGVVAGRIVKLHSYWAEKSKLPAESPFVVAEIDLTACGINLDQDKVPDNYETLQDQIVRRDLNFVIDKDQNYELITNALTGVEQIEKIDLFDLYAGEHLDQDKKSIGLRIKIKGGGNMKTAEINDIMQQAIASVEQTGATLRE